VIDRQFGVQGYPIGYRNCAAVLHPQRAGSDSCPKAEPTRLDGGEAAHAARISEQRHSGLACCSMYCLTTDSGAPPTLATK
jgi:hypothetical protein